MANNNNTQSKKHGSVSEFTNTYTSFGGISNTDRDKKYSITAKNMSNFRPSKLGSLEKREGFKSISDFDGEVKAVFANKIAGVDYFYVYAGKKLYSLEYNLLTESYDKTVLGDLDLKGKFITFIYSDGLHLVDGEYDCIIEKNSVRKLLPYIPTIFINAPDDGTDPVYREEPSIFTDLVSTHFNNARLKTEFSFFKLDVEEIVSVYIGNSFILKNYYNLYYDNQAKEYYIEFSSNTNTLDLPISILLRVKRNFPTISSFSKLSNMRVKNATNGSDSFWLFGDKESGFIYTEADKNSEVKNVVSENITSQMGTIYMNNVNKFNFHPESAKITGFVRQYDRCLIFSEKDTWMMNHDNNSTDKGAFTKVNSNIGLSVHGAVSSFENSPVCLFNNNLYKWNRSTINLEENNVHCFSDKVRHLFLDSNTENTRLFFNTAKNELWIYNTASNKMLIYSNENDQFYYFTAPGSKVRDVFQLGSTLAFMCDNSIFTPDETISYDIYNGHSYPVLAEFESHYLKLKGSAKSKKPCKITVDYRGTKNDTIKFKIKSNKGNEQAADLLVTTSEVLDSTSRRCVVGNAESLKINLESNSENKLTVEGISINSIS